MPQTCEPENISFVYHEPKWSTGTVSLDISPSDTDDIPNDFLEAIAEWKEGRVVDFDISWDDPDAES